MFNDVTNVLNLADTSRHYYPVDVIKQIIESMSYAKLVSTQLTVYSPAWIWYWNHMQVLSQYYKINIFFSTNPAYNSDIENCIH